MKNKLAEDMKEIIFELIDPKPILAVLGIILAISLQDVATYASIGVSCLMGVYFAIKIYIEIEKRWGKKSDQNGSKS